MPSALNCPCSVCALDTYLVIPSAGLVASLYSCFLSCILLLTHAHEPLSTASLLPDTTWSAVASDVQDEPLMKSCSSIFGVCCAELLPLLVVMIQELRDAQARDRLTHCLFNLVKKPTPEQRALIMDGCMELASRIGPARTAEELLPQCWEQVKFEMPTSPSST